MSDYLNVTVEGKQKQIRPKTTYDELSRKYRYAHSSAITVARDGFTLRELREEIREGADIKFLDISTTEGLRVYVRSMSLLLIVAVYELYGKAASVEIEHSLRGNLYCEIEMPGFELTAEELQKIEAKMFEIAEMDMPIEKGAYSREEAMELVANCGMEEKSRLFRYRRASNINLYRLGDVYDYFYGYMVSSTGCLNVFELKLCETGFLLMLPQEKSPDKIPPYEHPKNISRVFLEQRDWARLMKVKNVADLNDAIVRGEFTEIVRINEALHEKKISYIADSILSRIKDIKVVMIAGPSSSGKTTFAQRLCLQLRVNGIIPHTISMDDYFVNRDQTPVDEFGKRDYENVNTVDLALFNDHLKKISAGEEVEIPSYNFVKGEREFKGNFIQLG
ncbi:MAG: nucleoside kinase, partial [Firmicutes bacterium]|nr:nucleoside kinase [Bacillota bacterium]